MRSFPFLWLKEERMWTQVHWVSGEHDYLEEDYGPEFYVAEELRRGQFVITDPLTSQEATFDAAAVTGSARDRLWAQLDHGLEPHSRN
jgi:hypothetical protein